MSSPLTSPASTEPSPAASAPASEASQARLAASIAADLERALSEDVGAGDLTASLVDPTRIAKARAIFADLSVLSPLPPFIMKKRAAPKLPRMATKPAMTRYFMKRIMG